MLVFVQYSMKEKGIVKALRSILNKSDLDRDDPITRKRSIKHTDDIQVLLAHTRILVSSLRHEAECCRRELFDLQKEIDDNNM